MLKSSKTSSSGFPKIDMVLMRFHEYILDNLLLKDETTLDEVKKFYYGVLLLVKYLVDPLAQFSGSKRQNNLLTVFGTSVIEVE